MRRFLVRLSCLALVACAVDCSSSSAPPVVAASAYDGTVRIARNPWLASAVDAELARALLVDQLHLNATIVDVDEYAQWPQLAQGALHATLEVWPSGHGDDVTKYVQTGLVDDAGPLGPVGRIGWYVPTYMLDSHPELQTWQGLRDPNTIALFATPETSPSGRLLEGDPSWTYYDTQIVKNLKLDLKPTFSGSEEKTIEALALAYAKREPILLYFWVPHWAGAAYDLTPVQLPEATPACLALAASGGVNCDYPPDHLFKALWPALREAEPAAYALLRSLTLTTKAQVDVMGDVKLRNKSLEEAVAAWIAANPATWTPWVDAAKAAAVGR